MVSPTDSQAIWRSYCEHITPCHVKYGNAKHSHSVSQAKGRPYWTHLIYPTLWSFCYGDDSAFFLVKFKFLKNASLLLHLLLSPSLMTSWVALESGTWNWCIILDQRWGRWKRSVSNFKVIIHSFLGNPITWATAPCDHSGMRKIDYSNWGTSLFV